MTRVSSEDRGADGVFFLAWESPWPPEDGARLRSWGLLRELSREFQVTLVVLTREPLSIEQVQALSSVATRVVRGRLADVSIWDKLRALGFMLRSGYPYHGAVLEVSMRSCPYVRREILGFSGVVFTSIGHWGALVRKHRAPNWILNQCDADVEFWRVYSSQATRPAVRCIGLLNWLLSKPHFERIYHQVGRIISVCAEDKELTSRLAPSTPIDVVENGVDCSYLVPDRPRYSDSSRLLFTGTSAARNMRALKHFARNVLPLVEREVPQVELLVGGNFTPEAQARFQKYSNIKFTGRVADLRAAFDVSDVFVAPFSETHGSKLKVAEAMAMGLPIVSTSQGIRGFSLVDGESVLIAHDDQSFAASIIALLRDPVRRERIGAAARSIALSTIDWSVLGRRLNSIVYSVQRELRGS